MKKIGSFFYKPKSKDGEARPKRWNIFAIIGKALRRTCTAIGALVLFSVITSTLLFTYMAGKGAPPLPDDMVLVFKIENGVAELQSQPSLLEPFPFRQPTIKNVIETIERAQKDDRVRGLIVSLKSGGISVAHTQELRTAIAAFKQSGKFTKICASSYLDGMNGLGHYYLASIFDEIWMQPVGMLSVSGPSLEMPFAKDALDKLGVSAQFFQREEYKSAMENFTNSEISDANAKMLNSMLNSLSQQMMRDIAVDRLIKPDDLKRQVDIGILSGKEALNAKLIDRLDYADVMVSEMREKITGNPDDKSIELIALSRYAQDKAKPAATLTPKKNVALIYTVGAIVDTAGAQGNAGANVISAAIIEAYENETIEAIILRVDSPGGSPSASETIRRALVKAQEKGKKVIVSMGPVAASGGYWIAADADKILAQRGTLTGSIGVVMGKFEASKLWDKMGVNWQGPQYGENADIWSINQPFDAAQSKRMNVLIESTYQDFLTRVAKGRNMPVADVRNIAKGRVWTGEQALANGLVDQLGGLNIALDEGAKMLGSTNRQDLNVIRLPREKNPVEQFLELFGQEVSVSKFLGIDLGRLNGLRTEMNLLNGQGKQAVYQSELESFR